MHKIDIHLHAENNKWCVSATAHKTGTDKPESFGDSEEFGFLSQAMEHAKDWMNILKPQGHERITIFLRGSEVVSWPPRHVRV